MEKFQKIVFSSERVIRSGRNRYYPVQNRKTGSLGEFSIILAVFPVVREIFTKNGFRHVLLLSGRQSFIF